MNRILCVLAAAALCGALAACSAPASSAPSSSAVSASASSEAGSAASVSQQPEELSSDLTSLQFQYDGRVCTLLKTTLNQLGMPFVDADLTEPVEPGIFGGCSYYGAEDADGVVIGEVYNTSDAAVPAGDCVVTGLSVDFAPGMDFLLPAGITGGSTPEQVEAAYGPATRSEISDGSGFLHYYLMDDENPASLVVVMLDFENGGLIRVTWAENFQTESWNPFTMDDWNLSVM